MIDSSLPAETITDLDLAPVVDAAVAADSIPVIDVAELLRDAAAPAAAAAVDGIASACRTWGFFQIVNHGITNAQIAELWRQTREFFALPRADKTVLMRSKENPWGFYDRELTKNQRDKKEVFDFTRDGVDPIYRQQNRWPANRPRFRSVMTAWLETCSRLSLKLLEGFCLGLDLPADFMRADFAGRHTGFVRLNYYPVDDPLAREIPVQAGAADLGIHHHTDAGALTVLLQDEVGGLQVYRDGYWHGVPVIDGALVINTGDMMQVWSNDIYRAALHRVLAMNERERYSIPFFFNPAADSRVSPLPSVIGAGIPPRYREIEWGEFRGRRSDGDYADYGAEVQISQYRIAD